MADLNQLFQQAERAFAAGQTAAARQALDRVERMAGPHPAVLHLRALVEQQGGATDRALAAFQAARRLAPGDAQIANNHGNLLDALGRTGAALRAHEDAVRLAPNDPNPLINRAITLQRLGELARSRRDFAAALALAPANARALIGAGGLEAQAGALDEAAGFYDRALAVVPDHPLAAQGRAAVAKARGEPDAASRYRRLVAAAPADRTMTMGLIEALDADGDPEGRARLEEAVAADPEWIEGHNSLARMRADTGEDLAVPLERAIAARPGSRALREALWRLLVHAERHAEALAVIDAARRTFGADHALTLEEAAVASEAGRFERAAALLDQLSPDADVLLVAGRLALRRGDAARAATALEAATRARPDGINAWAHLGMAWRLLDDPRAGWLYDQPGLWGTQALPLSAGELATLADALRAVHRSRRDPLGQSLRGGTQTQGRLFARLEPEIRALAAALTVAIRAHIAALPPGDPRHPLLRHRDRAFRFDGSWSVRLRDGGRHVPHIHPSGLFSSACYIALPPVAADDPQSGWLELGRPPAELNLPLDPIAVIEPRPGRLALFPSYLHHGTRPFPAGERLTVAFDLVPE